MLHIDCNRPRQCCDEAVISVPATWTEEASSGQEEDGTIHDLIVKKQATKEIDYAGNLIENNDSDIHKLYLPKEQEEKLDEIKSYKTEEKETKQIIDDTIKKKNK